MAGAIVGRDTLPRLYALPIDDVYAVTPQLILNLQAAPAPTLSNFIAGRNAAALDAVRQLAPGRALYLWGVPGCGRSHLLQALCASLDQAGHYLAAQTPLEQYQQLAQNLPAATRLLAVDDVHQLDEARQAAVFGLYNLWRTQSKASAAFALLLAGDTAPMNLPLREDLRTRLGWDLVFRLEPLDDDDRAAALLQQAEQRGLRLGQEVIIWILTHYSRNMGQLVGLMDALDRYSLARHRAITLPLLKELLTQQQRS